MNALINRGSEREIVAAVTGFGYDKSLQVNESRYVRPTKSLQQILLRIHSTDE